MHNGQHSDTGETAVPDIAACKVIIRTYLIVLYMGPYAPHAL